MASSSIALITINQRQTRYEAPITDKAHSSYVALICSIVVVTWFTLCTKLVDGYNLRRRYTYLSHSRHCSTDDRRGYRRG